MGQGSWACLLVAHAAAEAGPGALATVNAAGTSGVLCRLKQRMEQWLTTPGTRGTPASGGRSGRADPGTGRWIPPVLEDIEAREVGGEDVNAAARLPLSSPARRRQNASG